MTSSDVGPSRPFCLVKSSINIDETFLVPHIVRPGETISSSGLVSRPGGKGANVSAAIALAGAQVSLSGAVGKDATWPIDELKSRKVIIDDVEVLDGIPTGRAFIQIAEDGENSIVLLKGANFSTDSKSADPSKTWSANSARKITHLVLQNEIPLETTIAFLKHAKSDQVGNHVTVIFNPSPMLNEQEVMNFPWKSIDVLVVNEGESIDLLRVLQPSAASSLETLPEGEDKSKKVLETLSDVERLRSTAWIVLTRGSKGVMANVQLSENKDKRSFFSVPPFKPKQVCDTTGAGDTFAGNLVAALMGHNVDANESLNDSVRPKTDKFIREAMEWASKAASLACEKEGAMQSIPSAEEVKARSS
ncbi:related to RBK1 - putative ribokinase [Melanopsichium pennsylvanicum]|uniref:Ribokinase n=2 Tax=Melanopsichium pennsylvanicum TaxID=63383 RepID=A0AAJ4XQR5_9BASI|nr:atp binding protein [Melanopsichium pennsylvanicum 4]SNX87080.1 related to RBK1 - putative ribokinase [Melanopsichium pennsylvanicum]